VWGNHVVSPEEEKERLQWEGFAENEGFESGMKERVGDERLIIISVAVRDINDHIGFYILHSCVSLTFLASFTVFVCFDFCTSDLLSTNIIVVRRFRAQCGYFAAFHMGSTYNDKPVVAGYTGRHCLATVQCAKIRRCDDTGDFTAWPVTPPWQPSR